MQLNRAQTDTGSESHAQTDAGRESHAEELNEGCCVVLDVEHKSKPSQAFTDRRMQGSVQGLQPPELPWP